jgi:hypothetical protein
VNITDNGPFQLTARRGGAMLAQKNQFSCNPVV